MSTFYVDFENGNDSNDGLSFANRWKTLTSGATAVRIAPGDVIRVMASPPPVLAGTIGKWTQGQNYMTLPAGTVKIIDPCEDATGWTLGSGVTIQANTNRKNGAYSLRFTLNGTATGKLGWRAISSLNLTGYSQVSFQFRSSITLGASPTLELRLYTNAAATDPPAKTIPIKIPTVSGDRWIAALAYWQPIVIDVGDIGAGIQSWAIYASAAPGVCDLYFDNIVACKPNSSADAFTHRSLIGRTNSPGCGGDDSEAWYPIAGFDDQGNIRVYFDAHAQSNPPGSNVKYGGADTGGADVPTWRRECLRLWPQNGTSIAPAEMTFNDDGTFGNPITYSFGWDRTNMSSQTDGTYLDGSNGNGACVYLNARNFISIERLSAVRFYYGIYHSGGNPHTLKADCLISCYNALRTSTAGTYNEIKWVVNTGNDAISSLGINNIVRITGGIMSAGNASIQAGNQDGTVIDCAQCYSSSNAQMFWLGPTLVRNCRFWGAGTTHYFYNYHRNFRMLNCLLQDSGEGAGGSSYSNPRIYSENHNQILGKTKEYSDNCWMEAVNDADRRTASGWAYKIAVINSATARSTPQYPADFIIGRVYCKATRPVTVSAWMKRSHATGINGRLIVRGGQIAGVSSDVYADLSAAAGTYQELTLNFTPTSDGWMNIEAHVWANTTTNFVWVDDLTVSGAMLNTEMGDLQQDGRPFNLPVNVQASGGNIIVIDD